jgi:hypothetical protein
VLLLLRAARVEQDAGYWLLERIKDSTQRAQKGKGATPFIAAACAVQQARTTLGAIALRQIGFVVAKVSLVYCREWGAVANVSLSYCR